MPELYEKFLIGPGWYMADGGPMLVTPERIDRWERYFKHLKAQGFQFPTPWGHKLTAVPTDQDPYALDEAYSRWNAGYIHDVKKNPDGSLNIIGEVPPGYQVAGDGRLINPTDHTTIREVSPGFGDWVDGYGREHKDILFHAALVTHPVQAGQPGFKPAGQAAQAAGVRFLSAGGRIRRAYFLATPKGTPMADDKDKDKGKKDAFGGGAAEDKKPIGAEGVKPDEPDSLDLGDGGGSPGEGTVIPEGDPPAPSADPPGAEVPPTDPAAGATPPAEPPAPDPAGLGQMGFSPTQVEQVKQIMAQLGQPLLPDTNQQNICERIIILLHAAANQGASLVAGGNQPQGQPLDLSMQGATPDQGMSGIGGGMGAMGSPVFMSTKTGRPLQLDSAGMRLAERAADTERQEIAAAWDKLAAKGPAELRKIAEDEKALLGRFHLSLNPDTGQVMNRAARARLADAKKLLKAAGVYTITRQLSTSRAQAGPADHAPRATPSTAPAPTSDDALRTEIARLTGVDPKLIDVRHGVPANGKLAG